LRIVLVPIVVRCVFWFDDVMRRAQAVGAAAQIHRGERLIVRLCSRFKLESHGPGNYNPMKRAGRAGPPTALDAHDTRAIKEAAELARDHKEIRNAITIAVAPPVYRGSAGCLRKRGFHRLGDRR
jgi:hypothetical protein